MKSFLTLFYTILASSTVWAQSDYSYYDFRAFDYQSFAQPYNEYKPKQLEYIGWQSQIRNYPKRGVLEENYQRHQDGYYQTVKIEYPKISFSSGTQTNSPAPQTVLVGVSPMQDTAVAGAKNLSDYKNSTRSLNQPVAPFLPSNMPNKNTEQLDTIHASQNLQDKQAQMAYKYPAPTQTALWENSDEPYFSYCMPRKTTVDANGYTSSATLCQTVNRPICESVQKNLKTANAAKTAEISHAIAVRKQLAMMKKTVNVPPSNDFTPSPELVRACDTFNKAFPNNNKQPGSRTPAQIYRGKRTLSDK